MKTESKDLRIHQCEWQFLIRESNGERFIYRVDQIEDDYGNEGESLTTIARWYLYDEVIKNDKMRAVAQACSVSAAGMEENNNQTHIRFADALEEMAREIRREK